MTAPRPATQPLAAIDIGTNSIRLLVAAPAPGGAGLMVLADRTEMVRLGTGVERTGRLDPERVRRAVATVAEFHRVARSHQAAPILVAATSAVRDAANGAELRRDIERLDGVTMAIIDGAREAALTFAGATMGRRLGGTVLVGDLGGGSLELIVARDGAVREARSLQIGSGRLAERHFATDPPDRAMLAAVEEDARAALAPVAADPPADRLVMVGGTAQSLPLLTPKPDGNERLTLRRLNGALAVLTGAPSDRVAAETGLDRERVRTMPAGAAIIIAILAAYDLDSAEVSRGGLREGLILDYLRDARAEG
jgi:exopolyphosphatase/guanosine-5'-triphosphate,3'-diphosphate pyrophosphatase